MAEEPVTIPSFRVVFSLERRLFRIGDHRIPVPYGLPLAGLGWFIAALAGVFLVGRLPVTGAIAAALPLPVTYLALPLAISLGLSRLRPDGRPAWRLLRSLARARLVPDACTGLRVARAGSLARVEDVTLAPDGRGPRLPRARVSACSFVLRYRCEAWAEGRTLHLRQVGDVPLYQGTRVTLRAGERAVFHGVMR